VTLWLAVLLSAGPCEGCHLDVHAEYAKALHSHAHDDAAFAASWNRVSRRPWCSTCHDPTRTGRGLTCELCHEATAQNLQGHEARAEPELSNPGLCAHCHQFRAPEPWLSTVPMQNTVAEWEAARAKGEPRTCVGCHFQGVEHGTRGGHEARSSLVVTTLTKGCVTLSAPEAGHSVPTGDPFHQLVLRLCEDTACRKILASRWLRRTIVATDAGVVELEDTRVPAGVLGSRTECFPPSQQRATTWQLEAVHAEAGLEEGPGAERRRVVGKGALTWPRADAGLF
jgi:hypothetical protein